MATTIYSFRPHESLSVIAKRYHTDIKTLTTLNSWLINPHTGKTEMFPGRIKYIYTQSSETAQTIVVEKSIKPNTIYIKAYPRADKSGRYTILRDDGKGHITVESSTTTLFNVNYTARTLDAVNLISLQSRYLALDIQYEADLAKDYLVVPLIGNGNTSIEDYWETVDKVTGISFGSLMENLAMDDKQLLDTATLYSQTDNTQLTTATLAMLNNNISDAVLNSDPSITDSAISENNYDGEILYDSKGNIITNSGNFSGLKSDNQGSTDFTTARIGGIVQTAINEGSKNMRDYFLYNIEHSNNGLYHMVPDPQSGGSTRQSYTYNKVKQVLDSATAGGYTAAIYGNHDKDLLTFHTYSNGLYGSLDNELDTNSIVSSQNGSWSREKRHLYTYKTIGTHRDNSILQAVEVTIGNTLIYMPCWPESVQDKGSAQYETPEVPGRSAPYVIYNKTDSRSISFTFKLHREMLDTSIAQLTEAIARNPDSVATRAGEIDQIVRILESAVYPNYDSTVAAVRTQVRIGNTLYISGVMTDIDTNWYGPIGSDLKYKQCDVTFTVLEVTNNPKSQSQIAKIGGWRTT